MGAPQLCFVLGAWGGALGLLHILRGGSKEQKGRGAGCAPLNLLCPLCPPPQNNLTSKLPQSSSQQSKSSRGVGSGGGSGGGVTKRGGDPHRGILLGGGLGTPWGILDEGCRTLGEFMGVLRGVWGPQLGFRGLSPCGGAVGVSTGVSAEVSVGVSAGVSTGGPGGVPPSVPPISRAVREVTAQETAAPSPPGPPAAASEGAPTPGDAAEGG